MNGEFADKSAGRPIRVMHLITDSGIGGAEKIMAELASRLDPGQFTCRVVSLKEPGATAQKLIERGIQVDSLYLPSRMKPGYLLAAMPALLRLLKLIRSFRPQILHCWLFQANLMGRFAARLAGVPVNISGLRVIEMEHRSQYLPDRLTRGLVTRYVAVCEAVARHYREWLRLPPSKLTVILNGVEPAAKGERDREAARRELEIPEGHPVIGFLGRLHPQKGVDLLLEAFSDVVIQYPRALLLIAGKGPMMEELAAQAKERGLKERVRFLGECEKPRRFLAALDLLVLPSRWEGLPNVAIEAMAQGLPVVATGVGGTPELVVSGEADHPRPDETGILVAPGDVGELARAIMALLADPDRAAAMGKRARDRALSEFGLASMIQKYGELYQELIRSRG